MSAPAQRYAEFFAGLTPAALTGLEGVFAPNARFVDPFNDVRGIAAIQRVFEHMFAVCGEARFEITEIVSQGDVAYLRWRFHFRLRRQRTAGPPIEGVSRVRFDGHGRALEHVDYWDAAGQLYARFPLLGGVMRWLRRRLSVA